MFIIVLTFKTEKGTWTNKRNSLVHYVKFNSSAYFVGDGKLKNNQCNMILIKEGKEGQKGRENKGTNERRKEEKGATEDEMVG